MDFEEQQELVKALQEVLKSHCGGREHHLLLSVEISEKGDGQCLSLFISSLTRKKPFGSWKGISYSIANMSSDLLNKFRSTDNNPTQPVRPKA